MRLAALLLVTFALPVLASSKEQRQRGATLFTARGCQHCHTIGDVGGHRGPNLSSVGKTASKAAIRNQIVNGSKVMPAFRGMLEAQEINDLVEYLRSCRKKPKEVSPAPLR
jgi:mono/diheme cytochrome c family protein